MDLRMMTMMMMRDQGSAHGSSVRSRLTRGAREPFLQFLAVGFLVWSGVEAWHARDARYTVRLGSSDQQRIIAGYRQQFGQPPSPEQLRGLLDRYVREEILFREGLALDLDKDDEIVRRRIVQKFEFLQNDLAVPDPPATGALERWFDGNKSRYLTPERVAFSQVYFATDREGEQAAKTRATRALDTLRGRHASRDLGLGDAFPGPSDFGALALAEARKLFGDSELTQQLFTLPVGRWAGPLRSGYGWHVVHVAAHLPPVLPRFAEVRERALDDYLDEERRRLNADHLEKLRSRYTIRIEGDGR
jgi:peptidyl-prolyl cis-trans isomerase C